MSLVTETKNYDERIDEALATKWMQERHEDLVYRLKKRGTDILATMTPLNAELANAAFGMMGEAAEAAEHIKKYVFSNQVLNMEKLKEELGDLEFYIEWLRQSLGIQRTQTLEANCDKLNARFPSGDYSDEQAINRVDKESI